MNTYSTVLAIIGAVAFATTGCQKSSEPHSAPPPVASTPTPAVTTDPSLPAAELAVGAAPPAAQTEGSPGSQAAPGDSIIQQGEKGTLPLPAEASKDYTTEPEKNK